MPTYVFRNRKTGLEWQTLVTLSEREVILLDPDVEQVPCAAFLHSGRGMKKPDREFRDRLKHIKQVHSQGFTKSTINDY
jgi:hypothetical protein